MPRFRFWLLVAVTVMLTACGERLVPAPAETPPNPPSSPPPQQEVPTEPGVYYGFVGRGNGTSGESIFGHPMLVDGTGRAMVLACTADASGFLIDLHYERDGDAIAVAADVRYYPSTDAQSGASTGTFIFEDELTVDPFELQDADGPTGVELSFDGWYQEAASEIPAAIPQIAGHYAATGTTDTDGAFDSEGNRFEVDISSDGKIGLGTCWRGVLSPARTGKSIILVLNGTPACPTGEVISGLMQVRDDELYLLLKHEDSAKIYYGTFPR